MPFTHSHSLTLTHSLILNINKTQLFTDTQPAEMSVANADLYFFL